MKKHKTKSYLPKFLAVVFISFLYFTFKIGNFFALDDYFSILDVSVLSQSESAEFSYVDFEENKIKTDAVFHKLGDYITYKIKIKNNSNTTYTIKSLNNKSENEYITYEYDKYENVKINANEENEFLFTAKYTNELNDISKRKQDFLTEFVFSLENEKGETLEKSIKINNDKNPQTGDIINKHLAFFVICILILVVIFIHFLKKPKTKHYKKNKHIKFFGIFFILILNLFLFASKAKDLKEFNIILENSINLKDKLIVTYNVDEKSNKLQINYGELLTLETPTKNDYKFENWLINDDSIFDISKPITDDITITAKFTPNKKAKFASGSLVNIKMKQLAGNETPNINSDDFNILKIKKSNEIMDKFKTNQNIISSDDSDYKIYIFFVDGVIYYYSEADELYLNQNSSRMFNHLKNLEEIETDAFKTDDVSNMELMFYNCKNLKSLNLSKLNTSNVEKMNSLFSGCESIEKLDLRGFNTKKVKDMSNMFNKCFSANEINVSSFNTENVLDMNHMFSSCTSIENLDLYNFNTYNVKNMEKMFDNMSNVKNINFSQNFNAENTQSMLCMFRNCYNVESLNLTGFNFSATKSTEQMFYRCHNLKSLNFGEFNAPQLTNTASMFSECKSIKNLNWNNFNTSAVTNMQYMFNECLLLEIIDLGTFNTENVLNMNHMFSSCEKLQILDLSNFNTRNVTNMEKMFHNCFNLTIIYASNTFTVENVENGNNMFANDVHLAGEQGTLYNSAKVNHLYAQIDGGETNPGYFSSKKA